MDRSNPNSYTLREVAAQYHQLAPYLPVITQLFPHLYRTYNQELISYLQDNAHHINDDLSFLSVLDEFISSTEFSDDSETVAAMHDLETAVEMENASRQYSEVKEPSTKPFSVGFVVKRIFEPLDTSHLAEFDKGSGIKRLRKINRPSSGVYA